MVKLCHLSLKLGDNLSSLQMNEVIKVPQVSDVPEIPKIPKISKVPRREHRASLKHFLLILHESYLGPLTLACHASKQVAS